MKPAPSFPIAGAVPGDSLGRRMLWARMQTNLTLKDAAQSIGLSESQLKRIERGGMQMVSDPLMLVRAAKAYGVSQVWLYAGAAIAGERFVPAGYAVQVVA